MSVVVLAKPIDSARERLYEVLKQRGTRGVTLQELGELGLGSPGSHLRSLQLEGHGIESLTGHDEHGAEVQRFYLRRDAWA